MQSRIRPNWKYRIWGLYSPTRPNIAAGSKNAATQLLLHADILGPTVDAPGGQVFIAASRIQIIIIRVSPVPPTSKIIS